MTVVTIAEARETLPDLLRRVAAGEQIVIADGEKWLAALTQPARVIGYTRVSPEEKAAQVARAEAFVRECLKLKNDAPLPIPDGMSAEEYFARYQEQE
ncbi:MAG: hypothetical protein L0241_00625 [Planctomycetia bacterium]|nr:hypothetical protein [Planctomycetia bacterium]